MTSGRNIPGGRLPFQVRAVWPVRGPGSASCCRTRPRSSMKSCIIKTVHTEAINHDPAITFIQTGASSPAGPAWARGSATAWAARTESARLRGDDLAGSGSQTQPAASRSLWGSGFLPSSHQGVELPLGRRPGAVSVGSARHRPGPRRRMLDGLAELNQMQQPSVGDPEIARASPSTKWPFACRRRVPELTDMSNEPKDDVRPVRPRVAPAGSFAANCLLARRLVERGVRFVQLYHRGWDHHGDLPEQHPKQCQDVDQPSRRADHGPQAARPARRHAGRLGRRVRPHGLRPGRATQDNYGRDHHRPLLHHVDGRRRHQAGHRLRRDRRLRLQRRRAIRCTFTISTPRSCTASASITNG